VGSGRRPTAIEAVETVNRVPSAPGSWYHSLSMRRQIQIGWRGLAGGGPNLSRLEDVVAPKILRAMRTVSEQLTKLGIPHALVGGLAVGVHGYPRATRNIDFLVGDAAFQHFSGGIVAVAPGVPIQVEGVPVDPISIGPEERHLVTVVESPEICSGIPVAPLAALLYLKLKSPRKRDAVDVAELLRSGVDPAPVRAYLVRHARELVGKFDGLASEAEADDE